MNLVENKLFYFKFNNEQFLENVWVKRMQRNNISLQIELDCFKLIYDG